MQIAKVSFVLLVLSRTGLCPPPPIDVVLDLDGVILLESHQGASSRPEDFVEADGRRYRVAEGAREMVTALAADPRFRLSFFSAQSSKRNVAVLRALQGQGSTRSFFDLAQGRVFSRDHLDRDGRKSLASVLPRSDPGRRVLVDDNLESVARGEERGCLWAWTGDNHTRLARVMGALDAIGEAGQGGTPVPDAIDALMWTGERGERRVRVEMASDGALLDRGLRQMRLARADYAPPKQPNEERAQGDLLAGMPVASKIRLAELRRNGQGWGGDCGVTFTELAGATP